MEQAGVESYNRKAREKNMTKQRSNNLPNGGEQITYTRTVVSLDSHRRMFLIIHIRG